MKKLMNLLMLSCRKATELVEKKQYFKLNPLEKIQLYFHTRMCDACHTYEKQSHQIDEIFKSHTNPDQLHHPSKPLADDLKKKIIETLRRKK